MFAIIGGVNFVFEINDFQGLFKSCLHVLDTSIGNYDFKIYETIDSYWLTIFGQCYTIAVVVTFNILVLNLIIAILSNTYQMFDTKSSGLFLSKILQSRDEMRFDENYGSFLLTMTPLNCIVLPFVPYGMIKKPSPVHYGPPVLCVHCHLLHLLLTWKYFDDSICLSKVPYY
jgi:hypothetical protein